MGLDLDNWIDKVRKCEYLLEDELKQLCEYVSVLLPNKGQLSERVLSAPGKNVRPDVVCLVVLP